MGEKEKVTIMVLKVDLQCEKCYRKVKKVLCKFPQIRDQTYDEKNNQVIIKVVCCSPEKIRDRLCCKGGGAIKSIDIKEPEKPKPPAPEKPKEADKPKPIPSPEEKPPEVYAPRPVYEGPPGGYGGPPGGYGWPPPPEKKKPPTTEKEDVKKPTTMTVKKSALAPEPTKSALSTALVPAYPPYPPAPVNACCMDFYGGHPGGPCQTDYDYDVPAPYIQYDCYYGRPVYDSYSGGRSYNTSSYCVTRPDYFSEENPQACIIM